MTDKQLMQMALDWANKHGEVVFAGGGWDSVNSMNEWTSEVYARLSQCERCGEVNPAEIHTCSPQEPVAVWELQEGGWDTIADADWMETLPIGTKLYTAPPQREWQGLTDREIDELFLDHMEELFHGRDYDYERAIEAKLKEKNHG